MFGLLARSASAFAHGLPASARTIDPRRSGAATRPHRLHLTSIVLVHTREPFGRIVRLRADVGQRLLVALQVLHVLRVRGGDRGMERIGGSEVTEHARRQRSPRELVGSLLGVPARAMRIVSSGVQQCCVDEHRRPFRMRLQRQAIAYQPLLTRLNTPQEVVNSHRLARCHPSQGAGAVSQTVAVRITQPDIPLTVAVGVDVSGDAALVGAQHPVGHPVAVGIE